jgi:hypothetical protein
MVPAYEVKSTGKTIMSCSPSPLESGFRYSILGINEPAVLNEQQTDDLEKHINSICKKYGIGYLDNVNKNGKSLTPIEELFRPGYKILKGHNRHEGLLRAMDSLIKRNKDIFSLDKIR